MNFKLTKTAPNTYTLMDRETGKEIGVVQRGFGRDANTWSGFDLNGKRVIGPYPGSQATAAGNTYRVLTQGPNDEANVYFPECPECGARPGQAHDPVCSTK